jgi:replicative DNA helicase
MAEMIIAKNRSGSVDDVKLKFIGKYTRFAEFDGFTVSANEYQERAGFKVAGSKANNM